MATLTADSPVTTVIGDNAIGIIASDIVYEGAMVGDNGSGYGRPLAAGDKFLGHAISRVTNAVATAGLYNITVRTGRYRLLVTLAGYITDVGQPVYASDDSVLTFVGAGVATGNSYVGVVTRYVSATQMEVEFRPGEVDEFGPNTVNRIITAADVAAGLADSGKIIYVTVTTKIVSMGAIATLLSGYKLTIVNAGKASATVGNLIVVDPDGTEVISGGCGLAAGAAGKKFSNTAATAKRGDYIQLAGNATGWSIIGLRGTWAIES